MHLTNDPTDYKQNKNPIVRDGRWFFAHDVLLIEEQVDVDQYLSGVVKLWADMLMCMCCCAFTALCGIVGGCIKCTNGGQ